MAEAVVGVRCDNGGGGGSVNDARSGGERKKDGRVSQRPGDTFTHSWKLVRRESPKKWSRLAEGRVSE